MTVCLTSVKTKVQQRALAGAPKRSLWVTLSRLVRGTYSRYDSQLKDSQLIWLLQDLIKTTQSRY